MADDDHNGIALDSVKAMPWYIAEPKARISAILPIAIPPPELSHPGSQKPGNADTSPDMIKRNCISPPLDNQDVDKPLKSR